MAKVKNVTRKSAEQKSAETRHVQCAPQNSPCMSGWRFSLGNHVWTAVLPVATKIFPLFRFFFVQEYRSTKNSYQYGVKSRMLKTALQSTRVYHLTLQRVTGLLFYVQHCLSSLTHTVASFNSGWEPQRRRSDDIKYTDALVKIFEQCLILIAKHVMFSPMKHIRNQIIYKCQG